MRHRSRQSVGKSIFNRFLNVYTQVHYSGAAAVKRYFKFSVLGNVRIWCKLLCITSVSLLLALGKLKSMRLQLRGNHFHIFLARKLTLCITTCTKFLRSPTLKI